MERRYDTLKINFRSILSFILKEEPKNMACSVIYFRTILSSHKAINSRLWWPFYWCYA